MITHLKTVTALTKVEHATGATGKKVQVMLPKLLGATHRGYCAILAEAPTRFPWKPAGQYLVLDAKVKPAERFYEKPVAESAAFDNVFVWFEAGPVPPPVDVVIGIG